MPFYRLVVKGKTLRSHGTWKIPQIGWVPFVGVLITRAPLFGVHIRAPGDHKHIRILHSGLRPQKPCLVFLYGILMFVWPFGAFLIPGQKHVSMSCC